MPSADWDLALTELIFYSPTVVPLAYCLWRHRSVGITGWIYLLIFVSLQLISTGMIVHAGPNGTPPTTALIVSSVALSPLLLGIAGIVHEWTKIAGRVKNERERKWALIILLLYHVLVGGAIAIYAVGASNTLTQSNFSNSSGVALWRAGILILLASWVLLCVVFAALAWYVRGDSCRAFTWPIAFSLTLLGSRMVYQCVATFDYMIPALNPLRGSLALRVIFDFLVGALIVAAMVTGGILSLERIGRKGGHGVELGASQRASDV
ncbi:hypothetical protein BDY17DRAFT_326292 [Neohortaea acidophila]|uniref:DUF7702 domain-containing protein n=1 Tax=Neohortaea acidophila TaxID=245834 RepID=A0A6A6PL45_9PEZI|nr:uncharacterized protein BDY17DRAFT_326292 [Neohortaea acidophila]KAF2480384.1 hypothetical protein BDY17DRAFT_326292 [Neohortaea acidophila]